MTQWQTRREVYGGILPIWRACRTVDGIAEVDMLIYGTQGEAIARMHKLNAKKSARSGWHRSERRNELNYREYITE